jgi:salicylate hydroxylase
MAHSSPKTKFRVLIAGAGLGGLAAAIGIAKAGHEVEVIEQSSSLKEVIPLSYRIPIFIS